MPISRYSPKKKTPWLLSSATKPRKATYPSTLDRDWNAWYIAKGKYIAGKGSWIQFRARRSASNENNFILSSSMYRGQGRFSSEGAIGERMRMRTLERERERERGKLEIEREREKVLRDNARALGKRVSTLGRLRENYGVVFTLHWI